MTEVIIRFGIHINKSTLFSMNFTSKSALKKTGTLLVKLGVKYFFSTYILSHYQIATPVSKSITYGIWGNLIIRVNPSVHVLFKNWTAHHRPTYVYYAFTHAHAHIQMRWDREFVWYHDCFLAFVAADWGCHWSKYKDTLGRRKRERFPPKIWDIKYGLSAKLCFMPWLAATRCDFHSLSSRF